MDLSGYEITNPNNIWLWDIQTGQCITPVPSGDEPIESAQDLSIYSGCDDTTADNFIEGAIIYKTICSECEYSDSLETLCNTHKIEVATNQAYCSDTDAANNNCGICEFTELGCRPKGYQCSVIFNLYGECRDDCQWLFSEDTTGGFEYDPIYGYVDEEKTNFAILVNSGKYKRKGELGSYAGEMDYQDTKFNLGVEPLYKHFVGDKNCDMDDRDYIGTISKQTCGTDCQIICYNSNSSSISYYYNPETNLLTEFINDKPEYYLANSELECRSVGNTPVQCCLLYTSPSPRDS